MEPRVQAAQQSTTHLPTSHNHPHSWDRARWSFRPQQLPARAVFSPGEPKPAFHGRLAESHPAPPLFGRRRGVVLGSGGLTSTDRLVPSGTFGLRTHTPWRTEGRGLWHAQTFVALAH